MNSAPFTSEQAPLLAYTQSRCWMQRGIAVTLLFHVFYAAWLLMRPISARMTHLGDDVLETLGGALAAILCVLPAPAAPKQPLWKSQSAQIACFCGLSMACYTLTQVILIFPDFAHHSNPFPHLLGIFVALGSYPLLLLGIWRLPRKPLSVPAQIRISLDGLMVVSSVLTFSWYFVLGPTFFAATGTLLDRSVNTAYPFMDVLLASCLLFLGEHRGYLRFVSRLFSVGLLIVIASDCAFTTISLHQTFPQGTLLDIGWSLGFMLIGVAVWTARQAMTFTVPEEEPDRLPSLGASLLPYALLPAVGALVLYTEQAACRPILKHGVFWGAMALICLILARQVLALLENRALNGRLEGLATTDPLTGLVNHRTFHARLAEEAEAARAGGKALAVAMLDLDNFKFFNDGYGHAAGDDVLRQVTQALRQAAAAQDTVGRFGGDEFALLLPLQAPDGVRQQTAEEVGRRLEHALSGLFFLPPGSPSEIPLTISVGVALFPAEAGSPLEALELADQRLMHVKTGGSDNAADALCRELAGSLAGFPMLNALVTAVDNKDRYTRRHSEDVLTYSLQIADEFGLDPNTRRTVQVAALLHDVGKIGVPDRVLRKPGALSDEEHQAVQQHPAMGAAIVGAVPGFEETLDVVRFHHERWDGGYPFGLLKEETPFLARVVSVADAFSAMTTDRPYRKGMPREKALKILEGGAGTQWDPQCVAALLRVHRAAEHPQAEHLQTARLLAA